LETLVIIALIALSYLIGSMASAVWIGKGFYGIDVRDYGSGNAGATNTFRVLGKKAGFTVLALDVLKGMTAASLVKLLGNIDPESHRYVNLQLLFGMSAVLGHVFPVFENFKGGKGIATLLGMVVAIHYQLALASLGIFIVILSTTSYVSLSSILAAVAFPIFSIFVFHQTERLFIAFGIITAFLVVLTHQKNIRKLVNGTENKARIFRRS
jgi:acyl phosphate:glycerol-3-phosphate acyltransferase